MLKIGLVVAISKKFSVGSAKGSKSWHANKGANCDTVTEETDYDWQGGGDSRHTGM
jgi:hypothetical protein